jgi:hypothetical protein
MATATLQETGKVQIWAPFSNQGDALNAMLAYAVHGKCTDAAILWTDATGCKLLKQGVADADGDVRVLIAHAHGVVAPSPSRPGGAGILVNFETAAASLLHNAESGISSTASSVASAAKSTAASVGDWFKEKGEYIEQHQEGFDIATVSFDAIAVGGAVAGLIFGGGAITIVAGVALVAGGLLLAADGAHLFYEVANNQWQAAWAVSSKTDEKGNPIPVFKTMEDNPVFATIEWVAPFLCLPDLAMNAPKDVQEGVAAAKEIGKLTASADSVKAATQPKLEAAQTRLTNYIAKRTNNAARPINPATVARYQRTINAAKNTISAQTVKVTKAVRSMVSGAFAAVGFPGTFYGLTTMALSHPSVVPYQHGWHDLWGWFAPAAPAPTPYPVMPNADDEVYHRTAGRFMTHTRVGDDPWGDMTNYLSIHMMVARIKPKAQASK